MDLMSLIMDNIRGAYESPAMMTSVIMSVLVVTLLLSLYEFAVYRLVSHRAFYNRSFNICITVIPLFISTIILCLQSNIVITLGTIGALAIIRFRTAIKDPVDMVYLLWSIHTGIVCGCQLYKVAVLTSVLVTILLIVLENTHFNKKPLILVFDSTPEKELAVMDMLKSEFKQAEIKSINFSKDALRYTVEISGIKTDAITERLKAVGIERFSLISYDEDNIM